MAAAILGGLVPSMTATVTHVVPAAASNTYAQTVLSDNPVSYWRLNETSGTTAADQENRNPGTILGGVTLGQPGPIPGGGAMSFDGSTGYVDMGSGASLRPTGPMSVEGWFEGTTVANGVITGSRPWGWEIDMSGSGGPCGGIFDNVGAFHGYCTNNGHAYDADAIWHHVVASSDGTTVRVYVDGVFVGTGTAAAPGYNQQNCGATIGANHIVGNCATDPPPIAGFFYKGSIAEVAFYNYALSGTQALNHYMASGYNAPPLGGNPSVAETIGNGGNFCWVCYATRSMHGSWAEPVDTATGNFSEGYTDLAVPGRGIPLLFTRSYNALAASTNGPLGFGWTDDYAMSLSQNGSTVTVTGPNGSQVVFTLSGSTYSAAPRVQATLVKNADGSFTFTQDARETFTFNSSGQLTQEKDLNGYVTSLAYNGSSQLSTVTDPAGRTLTLGYTGSNLTSVTDPIGRTVGFAYNDGADNLTDVTDVGGGVTHYTYDTNHLLLTVTDPRNHVVTTNVYDTSNRVTSQKDGLNRTTTFVYTGTPLTAAGGSTTITDPKGNVSVEQYVNGERVSLTRGSGTPQAANWQYRYDPVTLGASVAIDPNGHATTSAYDSRGNLVSITDGLGRITISTYDSLNDLTSTTDANGVTTTRGYDTSGNLLSISTPLVGSSPAVSQVTTYTYGDASHPGDVTKLTDPDSKAWLYAYDANGDRATVTDPKGNVALTCYDGVGRPTSSTTPKGTAAGVTCATTAPAANTTYDQLNAFGDVTQVTDPLGHITRQGYDADRNLTSMTDGDNNTTTYTYDADNEQTVVTRPDTTTLVTDYNPDGTVLDQKDGRGVTVATYGYDSLARETSVTDALGKVTSFGYDAAGNRTSQQDPGGNCAATPATGCTTFAYDTANEMTGITYSDGVTPNVSAITYDADGQRTAMTDGTGTSTWTWDSLHRLTASKNGHGDQLQYAYNLRSLPTSITYPGNQAVMRGYDDAGRLISVQDWLGNTTSFGYDADSNLTTETLPAATGVIDTSTFDAADRLTGITAAKGTASLFSATYALDGADLLTSDSSVPATSGSYRYTPLSQVCYAGTSSQGNCSALPPATTAYSYDAGDNLTQDGVTVQAFNGADELCWTAQTAGTCAAPPRGATTYSYDSRGNRTTVTPPTGGQHAITSLGYDQADRLTSYTAATATATYAYNGDGLRMSKTTGGTTTQDLWDVSGSLPIIVKDGSTAYVNGPGGLPLEQINGSTVLWLHHDRLGSTRLLTDANGVAQATYVYDAYGNTTASTGTATNPFAYAGQFRDAESGLYYLRARYYDPATAQFLTRDPHTALTRQPYGYVGDDPLNGIDPTGLDQNCSIFAFWASDWCAREGASTTTGKVVIAGGVVAAGIATGGLAFGWYGATAGAAAGTEAATPELSSVAEDVGPAAEEEAAASAGEITGYTRHGINSAISHDDHGVCTSAIRDAVSTPAQVIAQNGGTTLYVGANANVVLNSAGRVVTTYATNHLGWRY